MTKTLGVLGALAVAVFATTAKAQEETFTQAELDAAEACPASVRLTEGETRLCSCSAEAIRGAVWGTGAYTGDSNACVAAVHSGAMPDEGGVVVLTGAVGQDKYEGSTQNGITSRDWGRYAHSFSVAPAQVAVALEICTTMPRDADRHSCQCPPAKEAAGRVWGFGPYTADSDICAAALHAGYVLDEGGVVHVLKIQGLDRYRSGTWNDIPTSEWGSYGASIVFDWNAL